MSPPKYGLEEIKLMVKLVHSRITKEQIKMVLRLAEYGINQDNVDGLYDILASDVPPLSLEHTPPSSQPRSDSTVVDFESPPSSQGYPTMYSDNESNNRPASIDSPPYTDEDPWAGLPKDPNYVPRHCIQSNSSKNNKGDHNDTTTTTTTTVTTPPSNHNQKNITTSEKRTRDRYVFRSIHQDILNTAFFANAYPENDEKEILVDQCNLALEAYKNRPLRENEKMTVSNITNWFNNRRKEKKRKCYQESPSPAIQTNHTKEDLNRVKEEVISEQEDNI